MFNFVGIQHINFIPEGQTSPMQGYNMHFSDDTENENLVGGVPFKCFFTYEKAASVLGVRKPMEMYRFADKVGKPCWLLFNRKGKIEGVTFDEPNSCVADPVPADSKPKKL